MTDAIVVGCEVFDWGVLGLDETFAGNEDNGVVAAAVAGVNWNVKLDGLNTLLTWSWGTPFLICLSYRYI